MKKTFRSIMAIAIAAMTFTACEDVPAPYDVFADEQPTDNPAVVAEGSGTQADPFNVAAVLEYVNTLGTAESADQVYVKGIVASITEIAQGNFGNATYTISDDGTSNNIFTVYRSKNLGNTNFTSADELAVGDEVVVVGKVVNYNGKTPEFVQNASYLYSRNGKTSAGGTDQPAGEPKGTGTQANPYNATAAINLAKSLASGAESPEVYIKGKISSIREEFSTQYGNATFYISDDGTTNGDQFYVFRTYYLGNKKYTAGTQIKVGDDVIICGKVTNYQGNTPETVQNASYLYSLNGTTEGGNDNPTPQPSGEAKGDGTLANPFNAVAATNAASALASGETSTDSYYIQGKVSTIKYQFDAEHGTATFFISEDGTANNEFQIYSTYYLDNKSWVEGDKQIAVGDDVIIYGQLTNYNGTPETASKKSYIYSLTSNGGGNNNPNPGGGDVVSGNTISYDFSAQGFENAAAVETITLSDGTTLAFDGGGNNNAPKYYNTGTAIRLYPGNSMTVTAKKTITAIELTCSANNAEGQVSAAPGTVNVNDMTVNITAVNAASTVVTNAHTGTGATSQLRIKSLKITYAE